MGFEGITNNMINYTESRNEEKWKTSMVLWMIYDDCKWRQCKLEHGETCKCNPAAAPSCTKEVLLHSPLLEITQKCAESDYIVVIILFVG